MRAMAPWLWVALLLAGCRGQGFAQALIYVAVEGVRSEQVEAVRFEVLGAEAGERWACVQPGVDRDACPIGEVADPPEPGFLARLPVASESEQDASFTVRVSLFGEGSAEPFAEQTVHGWLVPGETRQVVVVFDEAGCESPCPEGFRCVEGECMEHCLASAPFLEGDPNLVATPPITCAEPCTETLSCGRPCVGAGCPSAEEAAALPAFGLVCEDGVRRIDRRTNCAFGCSETSRCGHLRPSNQLTARHAPAELADIVLVGTGDDCDLVTYAFAEDGSIDAFTQTDQGSERTSIRAPGEGDSGVKEGIGFSTQTGPDGEAFRVYEMRSLRLECAQLVFRRADVRYALLVHQQAILAGIVDVPSAIPVSSPPGEAGADGSGSSGGGGGSFGTQGASGGRGDLGTPGQAGASVDPSVLRFQFGAAGGAGTGDFSGTRGAGGGALQITAEHIVLRGRIRATGGSPTSATRFETFAVGSGGGGGGSGGSVLLEAATVEFACGDGVCVDLQGGRGGRRNRALSQGFGSTGPFGDAETGRDDAEGGGGGGGGAGFLLVRALEPDEALEESVRRGTSGAVRVEVLEGPFRPWGGP
ncbi:MAG: hypothetical protein AB8I08_19155 [Sandaracinaceae bacterium]